MPTDPALASLDTGLFFLYYQSPYVAWLVYFRQLSQIVVLTTPSRAA